MRQEYGLLLEYLFKREPDSEIQLIFNVLQTKVLILCKSFPFNCSFTPRPYIRWHYTVNDNNRTHVTDRYAIHIRLFLISFLLSHKKEIDEAALLFYVLYWL